MRLELHEPAAVRLENLHRAQELDLSKHARGLVGRNQQAGMERNIPPGNEEAQDLRIQADDDESVLVVCSGQTLLFCIRQTQQLDAVTNRIPLLRKAPSQVMLCNVCIPTGEDDHGHFSLFLDYVALNQRFQVRGKRRRVSARRKMLADIVEYIADLLSLARGFAPSQRVLNECLDPLKV